MKYAIVNNYKVEAFPKGKGYCICCNKETIAKCGRLKIKHWAHRSLKNCDIWWENETQWHRDWKSYFPKEWQEIVHFDELTGEKHIADIKTDKGIVIELQNSPISFEELQSRESFYKNMLWIINGEKFQTNFHILGKLPNPKVSLFNDTAFMASKKDHKGRGYFKYSENPYYKINSEELVLVEVHSFSEIAQEVDEYYIGHHLYDWIKPREVWFHALCDVFIDFGDQFIWKLIRYDERGLKCIRRIEKRYFIKRALGFIIDQDAHRYND